RRHTRFSRDWSSDVCSSDLVEEWDRAGGFVGEQRIEPDEMRRRDEQDRKRSEADRAPLEDGARRAPVERKQDRAAADHDQRIDQIGRASCREKGGCRWWTTR